MIRKSLLAALCCGSLLMSFNTFAQTTGGSLDNAQNSPLPLSSLLDRVSSMGYPIIKSVELSKGVYDIKALNAQGKTVTLHATAAGEMSTSSKQYTGISMANAAKQIEAQGYTILELKFSSDRYKAEVSDQGGDKFDVEVNPATGNVSKN